MPRVFLFTGTHITLLPASLIGARDLSLAFISDSPYKLFFAFFLLCQFLPFPYMRLNMQCSRRCRDIEALACYSFFLCSPRFAHFPITSRSVYNYSLRTLSDSAKMQAITPENLVSSPLRHGDASRGRSIGRQIQAKPSLSLIASSFSESTKILQIKVKAFLCPCTLMPCIIVF